MSFAEIHGQVIEWARERNILKDSNHEHQMKKLEEEFNELRTTSNKFEIIDGIGDMMIVLTILAYFVGTTLDSCYRKAYFQIKDRKGKMVDGLFVKDE